MKTPRMADSVGHIDDDLITAAEKCRKKRSGWMKWGSIAACFAILVIAVAAILPGNTPGENNGRYKDYIIQAGEAAIIWPWEYQTVYERYTEVEIDGVKYIGKGREVSGSYVGDSIGSYTAAGYDGINGGKKYTEEFEVYKLKDAAQSQFVAVKMEGKHYVFKKDGYAPPSTLGELMELVDLSRAIELGRFSEGGDGPDDKHYSLSNDDYIWTVLAGCDTAAFVEDDNWRVHDREYLSFSITSEVLGVYRVAMYVTEDGYLWTNAFSYQYLFNIGKDAAGKIINYAKENSAEAEYEPYRNTVAGTITGITDEYILVDDSVLCNDPLDGIVYKVLLNDLRISRYVDHGVVEVGDTVQVAFEGGLTADNIITDAVSISKATISGTDVLIPE